MRGCFFIKSFATFLTIVLLCALGGCSHAHTLEWVEARPATCTEEGVAEHYRCKGCNKTFADENAQTPLDSVAIPQDRHSYPAEYGFDDELHYKECVVCGHKNSASMQGHKLSYDANESEHYVYCFCGYRGEPSAHVYGEEGAPCGVCRYGGVLYELSEDESYYVCAGVAEAYRDKLTELNVYSEYAGLPVKEIGERAFQHCTALKSVSLGKNTVTLGSFAFFGCEKLENVNLNAGLLEISASAFSDCTSLQEIELPTSLITIGNRAFYGCTALKRAELPKNITVAPAHLFYNCTSLSSIILNDGLTEIETATFSGTAICELVIPHGVTEIPVTMCLDCKNLQTVTIPASVRAINGGAFSGCSSLTAIEYLGTEAEWNKIALNTYPQPWDYATGDYNVNFQQKSA